MYAAEIEQVNKSYLVLQRQKISKIFIKILCTANSCMTIMTTVFNILKAVKKIANSVTRNKFYRIQL